MLQTTWFEPSPIFTYFVHSHFHRPVFSCKLHTPCQFPPLSWSFVLSIKLVICFQVSRKLLAVISAFPCRDGVSTFWTVNVQVLHSTRSPVFPGLRSYNHSPNYYAILRLTLRRISNWTRPKVMASTSRSSDWFLASKLTQRQGEPISTIGQL